MSRVNCEIIKANIDGLKELFPEEAEDNIDGLVNFALGSWIYLEKAHREKLRHERILKELKNKKPSLKKKEA